MSSSFSAIISYLKPVLSESDYNRLNHDLGLRENIWKSQNDTISHRLATFERHNLAMSKELEHRKSSEGELHLRELDLQQKLTESNAELGSLRHKLAQSTTADIVKLKGEMDDYKVKLAESNKYLEILKKQCMNWSKENGDLKGEIEKGGMREKMLSEMCEMTKKELEMEKTKREELKKTKKKLEDKSEAIVKYATVKYKELELRVSKLDQTVAELSGPHADSSININQGLQTNVQKTIMLSDSDEDEAIKTLKRKSMSLEPSKNRSKQLKYELVNASTPIAASQIGGTGFSVINEHEHAAEDDNFDECWEYEGDILEALAKDTELCMKAVCALYQHHSSQGKSITASSASGYKALNMFRNPREVDMAKFLIDGDQEGRLKRTVAELEKLYPNGSVDCRKIAVNHSALLFEIYKSNAYRFFPPN